MNDGLDYIRRAIAQHGAQARVEVVRWEKDRKTGFQNKPFKVTTNATNALKNLQLPLNKRSRIWRIVLPLGVNPGMVSAPTDLNSLSDPKLIDDLKAQLKAELMAEMEAQKLAEEKPRKAKKKKVEETIEVADESTNELDQLNDDIA
jgi:murein L,D-transpeptidase YafK